MLETIYKNKKLLSGYQIAMHNHKRTILSWKSQKVGVMRGSSW